MHAPALFENPVEQKNINANKIIFELMSVKFGLQ